MPRIPRAGLLDNEATTEELWVHGLTIDDADDVWEGPAKYFSQPARSDLNPDGASSKQPARVKMVGPDRTGRLLTFILELPDRNGRSHVVTGWIADQDERTRYHRPGGRTRRR